MNGGDRIERAVLETGKLTERPFVLVAKAHIRPPFTV